MHAYRHTHTTQHTYSHTQRCIHITLNAQSTQEQWELFFLGKRTETLGAQDGKEANFSYKLMNY